MLNGNNKKYWKFINFKCEKTDTLQVVPIK